MFEMKQIMHLFDSLRLNREALCHIACFSD